MFGDFKRVLIVGDTNYDTGNWGNLKKLMRLLTNAVILRFAEEGASAIIDLIADELGINSCTIDLDQTQFANFSYNEKQKIIESVAPDSVLFIGTKHTPNKSPVVQIVKDKLPVFKIEF